DILEKAVLEAAGKAENCDGRNPGVSFEPFRCAMPADLDTAEEISFRAGHLEQALRFEIRALAKNPFVGLEPHASAAPVLHLAELFKGRLGAPALEDLSVERLA